MKAFLMFKNRDFNLQQKLPWNEQPITQDMELNTLCKAMASGDEFLFEVARKALLSGLDNDVETILYRQNILRDCLKNSSIVRDIYKISIEAIESKKKSFWGIFSKNYPSSILFGATELMQMYANILKRLRAIADEHADKFNSEGFTVLFAMLQKELDDEYFANVQNHLKDLKFRHGVSLSAELGEGNKGTNYILRKSQDKEMSWLKRFIVDYILPEFQGSNRSLLERIFVKKPSAYTFYISSRDESGTKALRELKDEGINLVANALAQSTDHILSFFNMLQTELAFYMGCLNLHQQLAQLKESTSFPSPVDSAQHVHSFKGLYDVCLALTMKQKIVGNDVAADHKNLVIITGANQGGKSTFLRSIGLSQLMMQCGLFVPADSFSANICDSMFTHFKREEDTSMRSGKLDEELSRMSDIIDHITSNSMLLFNESFAATNEREGSEIAKQIVSALLEKRIKVFFVTHLYEFAYGFYGKKMENAIFLRAERQTDTKRTFKLLEEEPLQTSFGEDLYNKIFEIPDLFSRPDQRIKKEGEKWT